MDKRALHAITELAREYEETADELERRNMVRRRAHEMWEEQDRPHGLHLDHWHAAERELAEDEEKAKTPSAVKMG
jgi:hypothetical protein